MQVVARAPVASFVFLACAISWAIWTPLVVGPADLRSSIAWALYYSGVIGPAAAALLCAALGSSVTPAALLRRLTRFRVRLAWYATALLLSVADQPRLSVVHLEALITAFAERGSAVGSRYAGVLGVSRDPLVSSDIIGDSRASIVDLELTKVIDGDLLKIMAWYDNEWGYANQMVREARSIVEAKRR